MFYRSLLLIVIFFYSPAFSQEESDDDSDFSQPNADLQSEDNFECSLSKDSELITLLNFLSSNIKSSNFFLKLLSE